MLTSLSLSLVLSLLLSYRLTQTRNISARSTRIPVRWFLRSLMFEITVEPACDTKIQDDMSLFFCFLCFVLQMKVPWTCNKMSEIFRIIKIRGEKEGENSQNGRNRVYCGWRNLAMNNIKWPVANCLSQGNDITTFSLLQIHLFLSLLFLCLVSPKSSSFLIYTWSCFKMYSEREFSKLISNMRKVCAPECGWSVCMYISK